MALCSGKRAGECLCGRVLRWCVRFGPSWDIRGAALQRLKSSRSRRFGCWDHHAELSQRQLSQLEGPGQFTGRHRGPQAPPETLSIEDVYIQLAEFEPNVRFAQYSTAFDADQISYYTAMGGEIHDWSPQFFESIETIKADAKNFRAYVAPGSMHCILNYAHMHTRTVNGVLFADWLEQLVLGETMPDSVSCDGKNASTIPSATNVRKTVVLDVSFVAIGQTSFARLPMMR